MPSRPRNCAFNSSSIWPWKKRIRSISCSRPKPPPCPSPTPRNCSDVLAPFQETGLTKPPGNSALGTPPPRRAAADRRALVELNERLHECVGYERREEGPARPPAETLRLGRGACRDVALLLAALLRQAGLAARLTSGYLREADSESRRAEGSLHAWTEVYLPGAGWVGMDPTNGIFCNHNFIAAAVGIESADVTPIDGSYYQRRATDARDDEPAGARQSVKPGHAARSATAQLSLLRSGRGSSLPPALISSSAPTARGKRRCSKPPAFFSVCNRSAPASLAPAVRAGQRSFVVAGHAEAHLLQFYYSALRRKVAFDGDRATRSGGIFASSSG